MAMYHSLQVRFAIPKTINSLAGKRWVRRIVVSSLALFFIYLIGGFLGVPMILRHVVLAKMNDKLAGDVDVGRFYFNPFSWVLKIEDFKGKTSSGEEAASFKELKVNFQPSSVFGDSYVVREFIWDQPSCILRIDQSGQLNLASLFKSKGNTPPAEGAESVRIPSLLIERLEVRDADLLLRIENLDKPFKRELKDVSFVMKDLRTNAGHDNPYKFTLATAAGEALELTGSLRLDPLSSVGSVSVKSLKLPDFSSFGSALVDAEIASGVLDLHFDYKFLPLASEPELGVENGWLFLQDFDVVKPDSEELYHRIRALRLDGFFFDIDRQSMHLDSLSIDGASVMLTRNRAGALELIQEASSLSPANSSPREGAEPKESDERIKLGLVAADRDIGEAFTEALKRVHKLVQKSRQAGANAVAITMQNCEIKNSSIRILDQSVQPPAKLLIKDIAMKAGPFVTAEQRPLDLDLAMTLGSQSAGSIKVRGNMLPSKPFKSSWVKVSVDGVKMSSFAGYCVPVIGRAPTGGGIKAKLDYQMKDGIVEGANDLEIKEVQFGPRVENSEAPHLPLGLAIAVLENPEGVINIDIPMRGDINHPDFSYGSMVSYAVHNVITKIATAPMSALVAMFPHKSGASPESVAFEAGQSDLPKSAEPMVLHLAKIMSSRPKLMIELTPSYAAKDDAEALAELRFEEGLATLMAEGEDREAAIKKIHKRLPDEDQAPGIFPDHADMEMAVRKSYKVREDDLRKLAVARAEALQELMVAEAGVKASRIKIKTPSLSTSRQVKIGFDVGAE